MSKDVVDKILGNHRKTTKTVLERAAGKGPKKLLKEEYEDYEEKED